MGMDSVKDDIKLLQPERPCEICRTPNIEKVEMAYVQKQLSTQEVITQFDCSKWKWYHHVKYHLKPGVASAMSKNADFLANQIVDKTGDLLESLERLQEKVNLLESQIDGNTEPAKIKAYTSMEAEIRNTILALGKIQGDFKDSAYIQVNNITVQLNKISDVIMSNACPKCKPIFASKLEDLK